MAEAAQIKEWQDRAEALKPTNMKALLEPMGQLNAHLTLRTYIVGHAPTDADRTIWEVLRNNKITIGFLRQGTMVNLSRWYKFIEDTVMADYVRSVPKIEDKGANFNIGLPDTDAGVITRFPPEPSGYLHIGHAKAALLNDYFAHDEYKGPNCKMLLRFDDTNPSKEKQEFQDAIVQDLALMGVKPDERTHTSDYFPQLYEYCVKMIESGQAYADDTDKETMRIERGERIESKNRNNPIKDNLANFQAMKDGTPDGLKFMIRAKINTQDNNGTMRDPVIYRCNADTSHHRTGTTWKIYPTYDFACPIVDSLEGVTHALRTTEYDDRIAQYQWMLTALNLRRVHNWHFAKMSFVRVPMSKRKLTVLVDQGFVWGWDDPRMPTIRGVRRRGMTVKALREFVLAQGPSKMETLMDWSAIWASNKKIIDPIAPRYVAIDTQDRVTCTVVGAPAAPRTEDRDLHLKNPEVGKKKVVLSQNIIVCQDDAATFVQDEEITLMNWGNAIVRRISHALNPLDVLPGRQQKVTHLELELHLQGNFKTTEKKVTWLSTDQELIPVKLYDFDHILTKDLLDKDDDILDFAKKDTETLSECLADCNVAGIAKDAILQFDRKGYFRCDRAFQHGEPAVFFNIPTGKEKTPAVSKVLPDRSVA